MPWPLYLALKQLFPTGRVSFFTLISVLGVGLGVALMLVSTSVMGGFGHQIQRMIVDTQGEVQVRARALLDAPAAAAVERTLASTPGVAAAAPFATGVVMLERQRRPAFPSITGLDVARARAVVPLDRYLVAGSFDDLDDDSVVVSSILARTLGIGVGDTVSVYSPLMMERLKRDEILLPREVRVAAIFQIGHQQLDSSTVLGSLRLMQDLYGLGPAVHGFHVRLAPGADADVVAAALNAALPPGAVALTWFEANAEFQAVLSFERNMIFFLLTFIVVVAAFSITSSLLMSVVRKTREIGLLGAMGGRARDVALCFCAQGLLIGVGGTVSGLALGFALLHWRDALVQVIARLTMGPEAFVKFYQFSSLPAHTAPQDVATIVAFSLVAATLAGLLPAWRAARLRPVEALRSE